MQIGKRSKVKTQKAKVKGDGMLAESGRSVLWGDFGSRIWDFGMGTVLKSEIEIPKSEIHL